MRRTLVSALLLIAGVSTVTNTYRQQPFIARGSETLRSAPAAVATACDSPICRVSITT